MNGVERPEGPCRNKGLGRGEYGPADVDQSPEFTVSSSAFQNLRFARVVQRVFSDTAPEGTPQLDAHHGGRNDLVLAQQPQDFATAAFRHVPLHERTGVEVCPHVRRGLGDRRSRFVTEVCL